MTISGPTIKKIIKRSLRRIDHIFGIRAWLSSEPNEDLSDMTFLKGSRELEYGWVVANLPSSNAGTVLDVGCVNSPISPILAMTGFQVFGVDIRDDIPFEMNGFTLIRGDFNDVSLPLNSFDIAVLCSTVEHIGLAGRYDNQHRPDGDIHAMTKVRNLLKPTGICILTIPVGMDGVYPPWHRIYGKERLPLLLHGFNELKSRYFVKKNWEKWFDAEKEEALTFCGSVSRYAIGQFVLGIDTKEIGESQKRQ